MEPEAPNRFYGAAILLIFLNLVSFYSYICYASKDNGLSLNIYNIAVVQNTWRKDS